MEREKRFTRNKQQKIDLILKVAHDLLIEKGYDRLSTNHIAERSNIGIGTIYRNFPNGKVDIVREIFLRNRVNLVNLELIDKITESNLQNAVYQTMVNFIKFHRENQQYHNAIEQVLHSNRDFYRDFIALIEEILTELAKKLKSNNLYERFSETELIKKLVL